MQRQRFTPKEFGLKVRAHPDSLIVTARNKMRSARTVQRVISVSGEALETTTLRMDSESLKVNAAVVREFLQVVEGAGVARTKSPFGKGNHVWSGVPRSEVAQVLRRFRSHPRNVTFQGEDLASFLEHTDVAKLHVWDVVLPSGEEAETELLPGLSYKPQKRTVTFVNGPDILVSGKKARVGSRGVERAGIDPGTVRDAEEKYREKNPGKTNVPDKEYRVVRERPLLIIHIITPFNTEEERLQTGGDPVVALGLSFPIFDDSGMTRRVSYRVNVVEWRNLFEHEMDDEEDTDVEGA
jgi:hypothetical protein